MNQFVEVVVLRGRKVQIQKGNSLVTIHAANDTEAQKAASESGVTFSATESVRSGLIKASIVGDCELSVDRLRATNNIVHHVYRDLVSI